jgi:hypothetical protein
MKTNLKKFALATLLTGFGMWIVAGLWHNLIMPRLYEDVHATHEGIGLLLVAYFILAGFMTYLYPHIYSGEKPVSDGLKFGVIIGLLWVFPHDIAMAGAHETSIVYAVKNGLWHMVEQGIGGIIIATVLRKS